MASVLKVDSLQHSNGQTPTIDSLGLDSSGSVVQIQHVDFDISASGSLLTTASTTAVATPIQINFTPKFSNSILLIEAYFNHDTETSTPNGIGSYMYRDGVNISSGGYGFSQFTYESGSNDYYAQHVMREKVIAGSTATTNFRVYVKAWSAANMRIQAHGGTATITVTEIRP